tara:strand:- start:487 stop:729 length:243 start_codon:yes stop_codon:yes gene_type:complete
MKRSKEELISFIISFIVNSSENNSISINNCTYLSKTGLDSLKTIELALSIEDFLNISDTDLTQFFSDMSIEELADKYFQS